MKNLNDIAINNQHGAVLVMALLMLFVLTLIGVSSINTTTLEEKMSGNTRNRHLALQAAESAIREAERFITASVNNPVAQFDATGGPGPTGGLFSLGNGPNSFDAVDKGWWPPLSANSTISYGGTSTKEITTPPQYTIEYIGETEQEEASSGSIEGGENPSAEGSIHTFRITARGTGLTNNSVVIIQTNFGRRI